MASVAIFQEYLFRCFWVRCYVTRYLFATTLLFTSLACSAASGDTFIFVAGRSESHAHVSHSYGASAFSMLVTNWPDRTPIQLVVLPVDDLLQSRFTHRVLGLSPSQAESRWLRCVYAGQALQPLVVHSLSEMQEVLLRLPGAVGYLPADMPIPPHLQVLP